MRSSIDDIFFKSKMFTEYITKMFCESVCFIVQWNLSIAVTIGAKFSGCFRQVAALMK